jgi:hypothetical protein
MSNVTFFLPPLRLSSSLPSLQTKKEDILTGQARNLHHDSHRKDMHLYLVSISGAGTTAAATGEHFTGESGGVAIFSCGKERAGDPLFSLHCLQRYNQEEALPKEPRDKHTIRVTAVQ